MQISSSSKQPSRPAWTLQWLVCERFILLRMAIDAAMHLSYTSVLNSYLTFCKLHNFDIDPTPETLSLYVTYQSTFISPKSVDFYLSGIANQMESFFLDVQKNHHSALVSHTLKGAKRQHSIPIDCKSPYLWKTSSRPLITMTYYSSPNSSHGLLHLSELCFSDHLAIQDFSKISLCSSVQWLPDTFSFWLPSHLTDPTFKGSHIIIQQMHQSPDPHSAFIKYLQTCKILHL